MKNKVSFRFLLSVFSLLFSSALLAQNIDFNKVQIKTHKVTDNIYMLEGAGGNIGLFVGEDGTFMIDDQFAPLTDKIIAAIRKITDQEVKFLINTHVHPDHVGGNENFGKMGALIVASENVRKRLIDGAVSIRTNSRMPPAPVKALPVVTYQDAIKFHLNGETVKVFQIAPAHTDGDSFIYFTGSDVMHLGDVFRTTTYPIIDTGNGGTFKGIIDGLNAAAELASDKTRIIPGHGQLTDKKLLVQVINMYIEIRDGIQSLINEGKSLQQVLAARPTAKYDERWAGQGPFGGVERFVTVVYNELSAAK